MRLNKRIADLGYCSRREADELIKDAKVKVNGSVVTELGTKVAEKDKIEIVDRHVKTDQAARAWIYYKPVGQLVSNKDSFGRPLIFDFLPKHMPRVMSVGRLDFNSEGLLILTNKSDIARKLESPGNNFERIYKIRVFGRVDKAKLDALQAGIIIENVQYKKNKIHVLREGQHNTWIQISLFEGKNREIRKLMEHVGLKVNRLIRLQYGPIKLGNLAPGEIREIKKEELNFVYEDHIR